MPTIIRCTHKYDDLYNYNIEHNLEDENGFEINVLVICYSWIDKETRLEPLNTGFKLDYDSFEIQFNNHSEIEQQTINKWIEKAKENGTFEDAFIKDYFEC